jgi:hypothetical protein
MATNLPGILSTLFVLHVHAATLDEYLEGTDGPCADDVAHDAKVEALAVIRREGYTLEDVYAALNALDDDVAAGFIDTWSEGNLPLPVHAGLRVSTAIGMLLEGEA